MKEFPYPSLIVIILALASVNCASLYYRLEKNCIEKGVHSCSTWNNTVDIYYAQGYSYYLCFPEFTRILTPSGVKYIQDVSVGDQILSYSTDQAKPVFAEVTAWLHRDTDAYTQFTSVATQNGYNFILSGGHNIGYVNDRGQISYKYANQLKDGDQLVSLSQPMIVKNTNTTMGYGLYSPMTKLGNFYIFNQTEDEENARDNMVLVSCLSDIDGGHVHQNLVKMMIGFSHFLGINAHENEEHQEYRHPITHLFPLFANKQHLVTYHLQLDDQNNLVHKGYSQRKGPIHERSSSSSAQKQNKKKQLVALYGAIMQLNFLILQ